MIRSMGQGFDLPPPPPELFIPAPPGVDSHAKDCQSIFAAMFRSMNSDPPDMARAIQYYRKLADRRCIPDVPMNCPPGEVCPVPPECPVPAECPPATCPKPGSSLWWIIAVILGTTWILSEDPKKRKN